MLLLVSVIFASQAKGGASVRIGVSLTFLIPLQHSLLYHTLVELGTQGRVFTPLGWRTTSHYCTVQYYCCYFIRHRGFFVPEMCTGGHGRLALHWTLATYPNV